MSRAPADIFRAGITGSMLRWLVERGTCTASEFKAERVLRGGTVNGTHSFDRYFADKTGRGTYIPEQGTHGVIVRTNNKLRLTWMGSRGSDGFERAVNWIEMLSIIRREYARARTIARLLSALSALAFADELAEANRPAYPDRPVIQWPNPDDNVPMATKNVALFGDASIDETIRWFIAFHHSGVAIADHAIFSPWDCLTDGHLMRFVVEIERMMLAARDDREIERLGAWFGSARAEEDRRSKSRTLSTEAA